jgi:GNAT superfamily N-acetyltransferase
MRCDPLVQTDYAAVKRLFNTAFDLNEDKFLVPAWRERRPDASLGIWQEEGTLLAAAVVRDSCLEYIFVDDACRGSGIGTQLLQAVLAISPTLHLTPVNDLRVIRWYESQGFRLSSRRNDRSIYVRHCYPTRSSRQEE